MNVIHWRLSPLLEEELKGHYKSHLASTFLGSSAEEIIREFTFDNVSPKLSISDSERFLSYVEKQFLPGGFRGTGLEVGAGPGTWSALIGKGEKVERVYALEACEPIIKLAPKVTTLLLPGKENKVTGVIGDFDNMELPDESLDFIFDFFSLHHSNDINKTFRELYRVLKPGGFVLCFDKARPDYLSEKDLEALLNVEYDSEFKKKMGVSPEIKHTRRMNGEKEYRLKDWREAFLGSGFRKFEHFNVARTVSGNKLIALGKKVFSLVPPRLQTLMTRLFISFDKREVNISSESRVYTELVNNFPKEISLMIARK